MKIFLPDNIYSSLFKSALPSDFETQVRPSTLIVKELEKHTQALALIPSLELLNNKDLLVSKKVGISFDGILSNSYLYFMEGQRDFYKVFVRGDVSKNEILLSKILFEEMYSSKAELILDTSEKILETNNYLICGKENFLDQKYLKGISLADEIADMLNYPYLNYVLVTKDRESIINFHRSIANNLDELIETNFQSVLTELNATTEVKNYFIENYDSVNYNMTENEEEGLNELIKVRYYHGIIADMFDVKFV